MNGGTINLMATALRINGVDLKDAAACQRCLRRSGTFSGLEVTQFGPFARLVAQRRSLHELPWLLAQSADALVRVERQR